MNAACPHCNTVFRVDPARIPAGGARVRCSICRGVFQVGAAAPAQPAAAAVPASAPAPEPATAPAPAAVEAPRPAAAPTPAPSAPAPAPRAGAPSPFGASDPASKARRLARALVSDIVTYHPDRREAALRDGALKREFKEEIKKSWEEYVQQVGQETAQGTTFFRDALNDILARGQRVF
ncbi:MAG: zinc-ribbon domain-containing protein [Gemmatimonadota bacterium]